MELPKLIFLLIAVTATFLVSSSDAHRYRVGGKGGWIVNPQVRFNHWSDRRRFVVNDSLVFEYEKGEDSVLSVTRDGYYNCDTGSPVERWEDGYSEVALNRSGPFFFISGVEEHCHKGQRLIVVVLPWAPQPPISIPPESPVPHPPQPSPSHPPAISPEHHHTPAPSTTPPPSSTPAPHSSPPPSSTPPPSISPAPHSSPPPSSTPVPPSSPPSPGTAPSLSPADHPPASTPPPVVIPPPTEAPTSQPPVSPSPSSDAPTPVSPAPAPVAPSSSAITGRHVPWVLAALTVFLSLIY